MLPIKMAERSGFEPEDPVTQVNCLAGNCIQPLCHLSLPKHYYLKYVQIRERCCVAAIFHRFVPPLRTIAILFKYIQKTERCCACFHNFYSRKACPPLLKHQN